MFRLEDSMLQLTDNLDELNEDVISLINEFQAAVPISDEAFMLVCNQFDNLCRALHHDANLYLQLHVDDFQADIWGPLLPPSGDMLMDMFLSISTDNRGNGNYGIRNLETFTEQGVKFCCLVERWWQNKFDRWDEFGRQRYFDQLQNIGVDNKEEWREARHASYRQAVSALCNFLWDNKERFQYPLEKEETMRIDAPFMVHIEDTHCAFYQSVPATIEQYQFATYVDPACLHYIDGMEPMRRDIFDEFNGNMTFLNVRIPYYWNDIFLPHYALPMMNFITYGTQSFLRNLNYDADNEMETIEIDQDDVITI